MSTLKVLLLYFVYIVIIGGITAAVVIALRSHNTPKVATKTPTSQSQTHKKSSSSSKSSSSTSADKAAKAGSSTGQDIASNAGSKTNSDNDIPGANENRPSSTGNSDIASANQNSSASSQTAAPTELTNTGPGSMVAVFAIASAAGTVAYRRRLTSRLS
ncbi:MAG TPA: hypothetical protein VG604_04095 [Candidatus Saccharimonadales bacterium]|nr:hypothetical protein [Candidatus Saccharimonadales bacterium]